jgi:hypothetical protein
LQNHPLSSGEFWFPLIRRFSGQNFRSFCSILFKNRY